MSSLRKGSAGLVAAWRSGQFWLMMKNAATYIMANGCQGTIYVGVTSDLVQRVWQHRNGMMPGFTSRYRCVFLVYFEQFADMTAATTREKPLKAGSRARKIALIQAGNPLWRDLFDEII